MNFQGDREVPAAQRPTIEGKDREMFAKDLAQSMIGVDSGNGYHFALVHPYRPVCVANICTGKIKPKSMAAL